jgi:hypothetical protein
MNKTTKTILKYTAIFATLGVTGVAAYATINYFKKRKAKGKDLLCGIPADINKPYIFEVIKEFDIDWTAPVQGAKPEKRIAKVGDTFMGTFAPKGRKPTRIALTNSSNMSGNVDIKYMCKNIRIKPLQSCGLPDDINKPYTFEVIKEFYLDWTAPVQGAKPEKRIAKVGDTFMGTFAPIGRNPTRIALTNSSNMSGNVNIKYLCRNLRIKK